MDGDAQVTARIIGALARLRAGDSAAEHAIYAADAILDYPRRRPGQAAEPRGGAAFGGSPLTRGFASHPFWAHSAASCRGAGFPAPLGCQPMVRCTFSALDGPSSTAAIQGPGIDGSMTPSSSQV